ncbi:MAG: HDIG domain-containing protein [Muribaculaceae bacterium]|nr:HDIG domain-containing protein [Muribaculaceae bacterium]
MHYKNILNKYYEEGTALLDLLLTHSEMVARKALDVAEAAKLNIDKDFVYQAAMLHDIGIFKCDASGIYCYGTEPYIRHGIIGGELLRQEGADEAYARVCERHTGSGLTAKEIAETGMPLPHMDFLPETLEEKLICYADKFFSKSGDPREEKSLDRVRKSMAKFGPDSLARFDALHALFNDQSKASLKT